VCGRGNGNEFHGDAVVLEGVVHRVGIRDGIAGVAGVVEDQRGCGNGARISYWKINIDAAVN